MDVIAPFIADRESPNLGEPRQRPLHHPAMPTQALTWVDAFACDPYPDPPPMQELTAAGEVIRLVGMQLGGALAALPAWTGDWGDGVDQVLEHGAFMPVGTGQPRRQRCATSVGNTMALRARVAAIRGIRADRDAPFLAGMLAL